MTFSELLHLLLPRVDCSLSSSSASEATALWCYTNLYHRYYYYLRCRLATGEGIVSLGTGRF